MSSILEALKKVESTGPEAAGPRPSLRTAPGPRPRRRLRRPLLWGALAAGGVLAAAAGYVLVTSPERHAPAPPAQAGGAVQARLPSPPEPPPPSAAPAPPAASPPAAAPPAPAAVPPAPAVEAPLPVQAPPPSARIRPPETPPGAPPAAEARRAPAPRASSVPTRQAPAPPPRSAEDSLSRLDDSKLKVMAIAWAEDAGRRLAVVNGHIVREGESVDGYTVTRIRRDDLVVSDGSRSWRVELNLRQHP